MKKHLLGLVIVLAANTGHAHDEANCRDISNLLARLSCYDESHADGVPNAGLQRGNIQTTQTRSKGSTDNPSVEDSSFGLPKGLFNSNNDTAQQATLTEIYKHPKKMTRLYLDNGQIWGLVKERMMSASAGDLVEMKPGTMGGYRMSINGGSWFRVRRLN